MRVRESSSTRSQVCPKVIVRWVSQTNCLIGNDGEGKCKSFDGPFSAANDVPPELSVERCSSIVANWIKTCRVSHEACSAANPDANKLPHRLLDLRQREGTAVVLVESRNNAECHVEQYATLSHCWGKIHVIQTTRQNLALRMQGVEWDHLPRTFQDAITIVQALDIRFLWIDSLCIVQDDMLDWKEESVRMAVIYSNSKCTLSFLSPIRFPPPFGLSSHPRKVLNYSISSCFFKGGLFGFEMPGF